MKRKLLVFIILIAIITSSIFGVNSIYNLIEDDCTPSELKAALDSLLIKKYGKIDEAAKSSLDKEFQDRYFGGNPVTWELNKYEDASAEIIKVLLDYFDPDSAFTTSSALIHAISYCKSDVALALIASDRVDVNKEDMFGDTALLAALTMDDLADIDIISALIARGADPNKGESWGDKPLSYAINYCSDDIVLELLKSDIIDVNRVDDYDNTPLLSALGKDDKANVDIVRLLIEKGADPNIGDSWGYSPLSYAINYCSDDIVIELLRYEGIEVNTVDEYDTTPLLNELEKDENASFEIVSRLLELGADTSLGSSYGYSPIEYAENYCTNEIFALLGGTPSVKSVKELPKADQPIAGSNGYIGSYSFTEDSYNLLRKGSLSESLMSEFDINRELTEDEKETVADFIKIIMPFTLFEEMILSYFESESLQFNIYQDSFVVDIGIFQNALDSYISDGYLFISDGYEEMMMGYFKDGVFFMAGEALDMGDDFGFIPFSKVD